MHWSYVFLELTHQYAANVLTIQYMPVHVFHDEEFQEPVLSQCEEMVENANMI